MTPPAEGEPTRAELIAQINDLQAKLTTLGVIEQAKGALMVVYGLTADAAFALLRWHSQHTNVKLRSIATELTARPLAGLMSPTAATRLDELLGAITDDLRLAEASSSMSATTTNALPEPDPQTPTRARPPASTDKATERSDVPAGDATGSVTASRSQRIQVIERRYMPTTRSYG